MNRFLAAACGLALLAASSVADDKMSLELKLVANKDTYPWPYAQGPKEFDSAMQEFMQKKKKGEEVQFPAPPAVDFVLRITNTGKDKAVIHVGGDANVYTLELKGPGVVTVEPLVAFTTELRMAKEVTLEPGKSHEIPVKRLADGFRGGSRYVYPTASGEYTLKATYQLATADGGKGPVLKSGEAKIKFEEPRK